MTIEQTAPAGWYPDPAQPGLVRYWDGMHWSGHVRPASEQPTVGVTIHRRKVNHTLHLIISLVTLGAWLPVWLILAIAA